MGTEEYCSENERFFDFCLWEYPAVSRAVGKLRSSNVLFRSFECAGIEGAGWNFVRRVREAIGVGKCVWGVKHDGDVLSWEFYFYDYQRLARANSLARLWDGFRPLVGGPAPDVDRLPYFMFSLDVEKKHLAGDEPVENADVYIGNPGSSVSSGVCYEIGRDKRRLKNFYFFFDASTQYDEALGKLRTSVHLDYPGFQPSHIFWPDFTDCQTLVVANKSDRDGVYFSRVSSRHLLAFLQRLGWPAAMIEYVAHHQQRLDHLLFDIGFDYRVENGQFTITKSACYGFF